MKGTLPFLLMLCCLVSMNLPVFTLHHPVALASQGHQRINETLVLTIEPDATTAPEEELEEPTVPAQFLVHSQGEVSLTQQLWNQALKPADVGLTPGQRTQKGALHSANKAHGSWLAAAHHERHRTRGAAVVLVFSLVTIAFLVSCCIFIFEPRDREHVVKSRLAYQSQQATPPSSGFSGPSLLSGQFSRTNSGFSPGFGTTVTPPPRPIGSPPPVSGMGSMESLLRSPFSAKVGPPPDMSLRLPTELTVNDAVGATFKICGSLEPSSLGTFKAEIQNVSTSAIVASLQGSEDDVGSGILFLLNKSSPIAFLDTQGLRRAADRQVAIFGAADSGWDATATHAAVVYEENQQFILKSGDQVLMAVVQDDKHLLKNVKDQSGRIIAKFLETMPDPTLHIIRGADAGLILMATVASLKLSMTSL